jgi:putative membrane protein
MRTLTFNHTLLALALSAAMAQAQAPAPAPADPPPQSTPAPAANPAPQSTPVPSQTDSTATKTDTTTTTVDSGKAKHSKGRMSSTATTTTTTATDGTRNRTGTDDKSMLMGVDRKFANEAAEGNAMEVHLAQIAQQKSNSDAVKQLAQKIEQDHTQASKELDELAKKRAVDLPTTETKQTVVVDKFSNLAGAQFDKAYIKMMVQEHKKDVKEFEKYAANGMDSDLKAFAAKTLPTLREHLRMAEELQKAPVTTTKATTVNDTTINKTKETAKP